jgi:hypothetical protein
LNFATKSDPAATIELPQSETIEVPVKAFAGSLIEACGQNLAGLTGLYCIGYRGESYRKVHKLI